jgi:hypothetical protein
MIARSRKPTTPLVSTDAGNVRACSTVISGRGGLAGVRPIAGVSRGSRGGQTYDQVISDHLVPSNSSSRTPNFLRDFASVDNQSPKRRVRFGTLSARDSPSTAASCALVAIV